jgi:DNA-binding NarL/FixJ family response regulator
MRDRTAEHREAKAERRYVDWVLLQRAGSGQKVELKTWAERLEVIKHLTKKEFTQKRIAEITGLSERTVIRYRRKIKNNLGVGSECNMILEPKGDLIKCNRCQSTKYVMRILREWLCMDCRKADKEKNK